MCLVVCIAPSQKSLLANPFRIWNLQCPYSSTCEMEVDKEVPMKLPVEVDLVNFTWIISHFWLGLPFHSLVLSGFLP